MSNMSYCRFQNTARALEDCIEHLDDDIKNDDEIDARSNLIEMCKEVAEMYKKG